MDEDVSVIKELINAGADVNAKDYHGITLLRFAEMGGNPAIISLLRAHGAR